MSSFLVLIAFSYFACAVDRREHEVMLHTDVYSEYCPYNNQCTRNATKRLGPDDDRVPCCWPCRCDTFCTIRQDCCPDAQPQKDSTGTLPVCGITSYPALTGDSYLMWTDCPSGSPERSKCLSNDTFESVAIVSDTASGKIYRNKFCAICNGASQTLVRWQAALLCYVNPLPNIAFEDIDYIYNNIPDLCNWVFTPPDEINSTQHRCTAVDTSKCTSRPKSRNYQTCHEWPEDAFVFTAPCYNHRKLGFSNLLCSFCSKNSQTPFCLELCDQDVHDAWSVKSTLISFSAVVNINALQQEALPVFKTCDRQEIYDIHKDRCRRMFCPNAYQPNYGSCEALVRLSSDYFQLYKFFIEIGSQHDLKSEDFPHIPDLGLTLTNRLGLPSHDQNGCRSRLSQVYDLVNGATQFLFEYSVAFTGYMSNEYWIEALRPLTDRNNPLTLNVTGKFGQTLILHASMYLYAQDPGKSVLMQEYRSDIGWFIITYNKVLFCPHVELTSSEVTFVRGGTLLLPYTNAELFVYEYLLTDHNSVLVCKSDYEGKKRFAHNEAVKSTGSSVANTLTMICPLILIAILAMAG